MPIYIVIMSTASLHQVKFNYQQAFLRNLGWFTPDEQQLLSTKTIALPGLGGVGGHHLHNFLRMGFQNFHLSDFDVFDIQNFNRQLGASCETIGKEKVDVFCQLANSINPQCNIKTFREGVTKNNMDDFLTGVDVVVDTLDLYAMNIRIALYDLAHKKGIPVVTAGPFGMGTSIIAFNPQGMSFSEYFQLSEENFSTEENIVRFLAGITPGIFKAKKSYFVYPEGFDIKNKVLPSLNIGCDAAAAALGTAVIKILLQRGPLLWAPRGYSVDFYNNSSHIFYRPFGNRNPWQKLKMHFIRKKIFN
ncbi:MAG: ThiF family adenylyltransferase [Bdellovibrionales bacterium]|nr:ThiF family adenylyltransferase [Bdellovibrionales bacterium]